MDCVASVRNNSEDYELIVVDNGSTEDESWVKADTYIRFSENRGIAPGWNAGMRAARGKYIAIINDDIMVTRGWLEGMKEALDMPQAGVGAVHVEHLPAGKGIVAIDKWFPGSCFMLKHRTIEKVGYFDEQFFPCNFEDCDYWTRVLTNGMKLYVNYSLSVQHKEGQTLHAKDLSSHFLTNKKRFQDKWGFDAQEVFYTDKPFPLNTSV